MLIYSMSVSVDGFIADREGELEGGDPDARATVAAKYPTCGLATLALAGPWRELDREGATLEAFTVPRRLG